MFAILASGTFGMAVMMANTLIATAITVQFASAATAIIQVVGEEFFVCASRTAPASKVFVFLILEETH